MRVDLIVTQPDTSHYLEHLAPVWHALQEDERGLVIVPDELEALAEARGVRSGPAAAEPRHDSIALTAGWVDAQGARVGRKAVALMEHGVGQTYRDTNHPAYAGGSSRTGFVFLCPNRAVAEANRRANPHATVEVVGSPYLDWLDTYMESTSVPFTFDAVTSFHFDASDGVCIEAGSTRRYWWPAVLQASGRFSIAGHSHPRDAQEAREMYTAAGVPFLHAFEQVTTMAGVYVCDNSSTIYYAAALGIPVVLLNAPSYRREVRHGLRFWQYADVGWQVDGDHDHLCDAIAEALEQPAKHSDRAVEVCGELFPYRDGLCAARAVDVLRAIA